MTINFKIKNDMLVLERQRDIFSGNVNFYECNFNIQTNQELVWICVFKKGDTMYQQAIEGCKCMIPQEVLEDGGELVIGCYATSNNEKTFQRISTNWVSLKISNGAYSEGTAPKIPEKDVWETLIIKSVPYIGENRNWYIFDTEKMEYVDSGRTSVGDKGDKGDKGDTGLPGTTNSANALKGTQRGQSVSISDVSPVEHELEVKLKSKNIAVDVSYADGAQNGMAISINKSLPLQKGKVYTVSWYTENTGATVWYTFVSKYRKIIKQSANVSKCNGERQYVTFEATEDVEKPGGWLLQVSSGSPATSGLCSNVMIEEGEEVTEYTPYIADLSSNLVEIRDENGRFEEVYPQADGALENVFSSYPSMSFASMNDGTVLDVTYNRDINKAFSEMEEKFTNAIISLGGNV